MHLTDKDIARFWAKVNKTDTCWLWTSQLREGYGLFRLNGKVVSAHRVSFFLATGAIDERRVRHRCDTSACVNPDHLLLGPVKDNSDDKMVRDRHNFLLSNDQVTDIRSRPKTVTMCRDLASEFNTTPDVIKRVLVGQSYGWLPGAAAIPPQFTAYKLSVEDFHEILSALEHAKWGTQTALAKKYGVTRGTISHINNNRLKYTQTDTQ